MTIKFAHITDCHLGAWRNDKLREYNIKAFENSILQCIKEKVEFIVITGDFFDINIPDLAPVKRAVEILRLVKMKGIEVYMIYGSHDFSAGTVSIIDILHSAGLFVKAAEVEQIGDQQRLKLFQDPKTLVKIAGLSGRMSGLDSKNYKLIDLNTLESEDGLKIFLFHTSINELTPLDLAFGDGIPISLLPKGFKYYGGGHLHRRIEKKHDGDSMIIYPGPLFGATFTDLEKTGEGEKRGFYIIELGDKMIRADFKEIKVVDLIYKLVDVGYKTAKQIEAKLENTIQNLDVKGKIVLIKVKGNIVSGRRSDISFSNFEEILNERGATVSFINRNSLNSAEIAKMNIYSEKREEIEEKLIGERTAFFKPDPTLSDEKIKTFVENKLVGGSAQLTAKVLLNFLKVEKLDKVSAADYSKQILKHFANVLNFDDIST